MALPLLATVEFVSAGGWTPVNTSQSVHYAFVAVGWLAIRGAPSTPRIFGVLLAQAVMLSIAAVNAGSLYADMPRTIVVLIGSLVVAATLLPWGAWWQAMAGASAVIAVFVGAAVSSTLSLASRDGSLLVSMTVVSVLIAHVLDRQRRALEHEQAERQRDQEQLRVRELLFRTIFETAAIGMARFNAEGAIVEANRALHRMLGYDGGELADRAFSDLVHGGDVEDDSLLEDVVRGRCESYQADRQLRTAAGDALWGNLTISAIRNAAGDVELVAMVDDVTSRIEAEQGLAEARDAAEAAAAAKGRFLAIMSHEIRTPLNAVLGFNELLAGTELDDSQSHFVATIGKSGQHLNDIINDVLDFSKIESGALELEATALDIAMTVEQVVQMFQASASAKGVSLVFDLDAGSSSRVVGDPKRIRQIVSNLIGNAIKFTKQGTVSVRMMLRPAGDERILAELDVTDTGVGIEQEACESLFEPFVQADSSTTRRYGGTGLGLAICKQLVSLMAGTIAVDSVVGQGSRFRVKLPLERSRDAIDDEVQTSDLRMRMRKTRETLRGLRVLVVEDDPTNAALMQRLLSRVGCAVECAANGSDALVALAKGSHPIVLMDIDMPIMDGRQATHRIRTQFADDAQPYIIAVTAHVMPGDRDTYLRGGMNDYLGKPVHAHKLVGALERAIGDAGEATGRSLGDPADS